MNKRITVLLILLPMLVLTAIVNAQTYNNTDGRTRWEAGVFAGVLTGGRVSSVVVNGENAKNETETAMITGIRLSAEQEYLGLETSVGVAFGDSEISADPASLLGDGGNATQILADLNLLYFPAGNSMGNGRVRFFLTAGPGLAYIDGDFAGDETELRFGLNAGAGIKFLLGDQGNPVLRVDYRWRTLFGAESGSADMNIQEITAGIGFSF